MSCIFCDLAERSEHHSYENAHVFAVADIHPAAPGHTLVISKRHAPTIFDLTDDEIWGVHQALRHLRERLAGVHGADAFNVLANSGAAAGQSVMHAHVHIIPRTAASTAPRIAGLSGLMDGERT
jgi:diadenosine tetraphosphate (Ap4A) HIT family hydrolase